MGWVSHTEFFMDVCICLHKHSIAQPDASEDLTEVGHILWFDLFALRRMKVIMFSLSLSEDPLLGHVCRNSWVTSTTGDIRKIQEIKFWETYTKEPLKAKGSEHIRLSRINWSNKL